MKRYMGSKRPILAPMFEAIQQRAPGARSFLDPFAGTCAVSQRANAAGMRVFCSDLNPASREAGIAYTQATRAERFAGVLAQPRATTRENLAALFALLEAEPPREGIVFHWWCPEGSRSAYETARGRSDRRNYFAPANAKRLDAALDRVRAWWRDGALTRVELALVLAALIANAEKVANIQGTYGMPARAWQPGALAPLSFAPDEEFCGTANPTGVVGDREDALDFCRAHPGQDVLYLDPPYNFRIYLDYYHIPNVLASYPFLDDPWAYAEGFTFARGQNMADRPGGQRGQRFNDGARFHDALREIIEAARARHVFLSYFDGVNHLNDFDAPDNGESWARMVAMFRALEGYDEKSVSAVEIPRKNMQSQRGRERGLVKEYLLCAALAPQAAQRP